MRIGSLVSITEKDDHIEVVWDNPEGRGYEKRVSATFPKEAPFDPLTLQMGPSSENIVERATFGSYEDTGDGWRFPRQVNVRLTGGATEHHIDDTITCAKVNVDLPDSAFNIDLPIGTHVSGPGGLSYVVGNELLYSDATIRSGLMDDGGTGAAASATGPASGPAPHEATESHDPAGRGQSMSPLGPSHSGPSTLWFIVGAAALVGGGLLILASVRGRGRAKAGGE
jgi:hypothetical protein